MFAICRPKHVEPNTAAVDLCENVTDLVHFDVLVQFDVGDLILACDALKVFAKQFGIFSVISSDLGRLLIPRRFRLCNSCFPICLIALNPIWQLPTCGSNSFNWLVKRGGQKAGLPFQVHSHMLRHAAGYKLAGDEHDTRSIQDYLGHKNIQHTVRYAELSRTKFKDFWRD
jgi:Phage integrase family